MDCEPVAHAIPQLQYVVIQIAMLGIPNIRINSFKGKISVLNNLETNYNLTKSIFSKYSNTYDLSLVFQIVSQVEHK